MTLADTITREKQVLRKEMQAKRSRLPQIAMAQAADSVARHFADHPILAFMPSFAGYMAMRGELDMRGIFDNMARFKKEMALPRLTEQKRMHFRRWQPGDALTTHAFGMQEPAATAPAISPALVLVPLLAFDARGNRLGYGGGYYDATMAMMRRFETPPLFIGVGYTMQELERVPTNDGDQRLDGILTELGVSMFSA
jgi:5-formyltetrahydrofolate cyclo-ligase